MTAKCPICRLEWPHHKMDCQNAMYSDKVYEIAHQAQQAEIDRLMLEYCPDEMTMDQLQQWEEAQQPSDTDLDFLSIQLEEIR